MGVKGHYIPVSKVVIEGKSGLCVNIYDDREWIRRKVKKHRPDVSILELGSNDCAGATPFEPGTRPTRLVYAQKCLEDVCDYMHDYMGVRFIVVCEVIDRRSYHCPRVDQPLYNGYQY